LVDVGLGWLAGRADYTGGGWNDWMVLGRAHPKTCPKINGGPVTFLDKTSKHCQPFLTKHPKTCPKINGGKPMGWGKVDVNKASSYGTAGPCDK
jgi:hypothetical protein